MQLRVGNSGLVLIGLYLPALFARLELVERGAFVSDEDRAIAVAAVHCLACGTYPIYETEMAMAKLLCGLDPSAYVAVPGELDQKVHQAIDKLLRTVLVHWDIGQSSPEALRETFLQRSGELRVLSDGWRVRVESRPFDVLLDRLPWSIGVVKFDWMEGALYVDWRT